eukprot:CAMPEP_0116050834 /NCGR_PEP_ID=MMETSP0322-20121206/617_1 /TAXON_ID=163516 /ORGANISM="Leptocylindrus danicus var. apora, Strain B651" /LENGTH=526 /DNA_ID=CAMNT_0003533461 /DNA_START=176 /DNA_END=1755 /DNA_ORIENTATION=+
MLRKEEKKDRNNSGVLKALNHRAAGRMAAPRVELQEVVSSRKMALLHDPEIVSPHKCSITDLDINSDSFQDGRYLLAGSLDCTISVYDLSYFGSEYWKEKKMGLLGITRNGRHCLGESRKRARRKHIARSNRERSTLNEEAGDSIAGHRFSVQSVQWYPVDTGMFISLDKSGVVNLWDTNEFQVVDSFTAFQQAEWAPQGLHASNAQCFPKNIIQNICLLHADEIKLCDIISGSFSHELIGHQIGKNINSLDEFIIASASADNSVRLWDIRKSGSTACLAVMNNESSHFLNNSDPHAILSRGAIGLGYRGLDFKSLREIEITRLDQMRFVVNGSKTHKNRLLGPNNYAPVESSWVKSHNGEVVSVCWTPNGQHLVSTGLDSRLRIWDLRVPLGMPVPKIFMSTDDISFSRKTFGPKTKNSLFVTQYGSTSTTTIWCGNEDGDLLGFKLKNDGGGPSIILQGHISPISCITACTFEQRLVTGSKDGMLLSWGCPPCDGPKDPYRHIQARISVGNNLSTCIEEDIDQW